MTDRTPEPQPQESPSGTDSAERELVAAPWRVGSALGLVVVAFVATLLAGGLVAELSASRWDSLVITIAAGGVFFLLYAALVAIVWGVSAATAVPFAGAVGLRPAAGLRWYAAALGAAVVAWLFSAVFTTALTALGAKLPREDLAVFRVLPGGPLGIAITVVLLVVAAPFAEEVVYRGVLLPALGDQWGTVAGLAVSTLLFSAAHLSSVGFVPLFVAGALFGLLFIRSRSLWVAISAHAAYNALGVVTIFVSKASGVW